SALTSVLRKGPARTRSMRTSITCMEIILRPRRAVSSAASCIRFDRSARVKLGVRRAMTSFFFQAEDGIRDKLVTGVQTCALPICNIQSVPAHASLAARIARRGPEGLSVAAAVAETGLRKESILHHVTPLVTAKN